MTAILSAFRADCTRHRRHRSGRCTRARRRVLHALLERHDPATVVRHWLAVARVLDEAEREVWETDG